MSDANTYRTHVCGEPRLTDVNQKVTLVGFVDGSKMEGKAIDLRDRTGRSSCLMPEKPGKEMDELWQMVTPESVVQVKGTILKRKKADPSMRTGEVLVMIEQLKILSPSEVLPQELERDQMGEEDRFRYRILYLRRMQDRLEFRSRFLLEARKHLAEKNFVEIDTPMLGRADGEAPSSYIVPVADGKGYALPASPQAFKQAIIAGGVEKYFQVARCFRKVEETTPVLQPEFQVLDLELAYTDEKALLETTEELLAAVFKETMQVELKLPLERMTHAQALQKFATETPDLRARLEIADATGVAKSLGAPEAKDLLGPDGESRVIRIDGGVERLGDAELDQLINAVNRRGKARAAWIKNGAQTGLRGPGSKLYGTQAAEALTSFRAKQGDAVMLTFAKEGADAHRAAGEIRRELVKMIGDKDNRNFACVLVTDLPFHTWNEEEKVWVPRRHPFTQPRAEDVDMLENEKRKGEVLARAFTLVVNGVEAAAGGLRNYDQQLQEKVFKHLGLSGAEAQKRYGPLLENFRYGMPPHGGVTLQLERLLALAQGTDAIDEVMAFPKARIGGDLMSEAPMVIDSEYVRSLLG